MANKYYGVQVGRKPGVYTTWNECKDNVDGYPGAKYKSFKSETEAKNYVSNSDITHNVLDSKCDANPQAYSNPYNLGSDEAIAYVDGSFTDSIGIPTYGVVFLTCNNELHESGSVTDQSWFSMRNVAGEMAGAMKAMNMAIKIGIKKLTICHDYQGVASWCTGEWKTNKEGTTRYKEYFNKCSKVVDIRFVKVKGHSGNRYNDLADELAGNVYHK